MSDKYDVLVIGSGPGGYIAAIRAAQLGLKTGIVERAETLGGICLNWGCIPTKALLHGAEVAHTIHGASKYGFSVTESGFDISKLVAFSRGVSARLSGGVAYLMKKNGIDVIKGVAELTGKGQVRVTTGEKTADYAADHIILATGARPRPLPGIVPDKDKIWTYFEALVPTELPKKLLIVGSGAIGVEFANVYSDLGSEVTIVELAPQIMPVEDAEVSATARAAFEKRGITIHTGATLSDVQTNPNGVTATLNLSNGDKVPVDADRLLLAAGIQANTENLGLEKLGVELERGFIKTDEFLRTNVFGLYAIGDVAGAPCLAHKASHEAVICVEALAGVSGVHPLDKNWVPGCTYTRPEVASLGMTEAQAKATGRQLNIGKMPFSANGRALGIDQTEGFVKTIFDASTGELLGAHMVGPNVTEQLQGFGIAQHLEATADDLAEVIFAHPTLSEAMHESVLAALGKPLNQ